MSNRLGLKIKIVEFADAHQPGFVNCTFNDVYGNEYRIFDKVPVVTKEFLDAKSDYPKQGIVGCVIIDQNPDMKNPNIVKVNIEEPLRISSENEETIFFVYKNQLTEYLKWPNEL